MADEKLSFNHFQFHANDWNEALQDVVAQEDHKTAFMIKGFFMQLIILVYQFNGQLKDEDNLNAHRLYTNTRHYRAMKNKLLKYGLIEIRDGFITNSGCEKELKLLRNYKENGSKGGYKKAENNAKRMKNNNTQPSNPSIGATSQTLAPLVPNDKGIKINNKPFITSSTEEEREPTREEAEKVFDEVERDLIKEFCGEGER